VVAYSSFGCTRLRYALSLRCINGVLKLRFSSPSIWFALEAYEGATLEIILNNDTQVLVVLNR